MSLKKIKVVWWKFGHLAQNVPLSEQISDDLHQQLVDTAAHSEHACEWLNEDTLVEVAAKWWAEAFQLFIYQPQQHRLLRLQTDGKWYIDVGILWPITERVYVWTDLELDVITPGFEPGYHVLDIDEFNEAMAAGEISKDMGALALQSLHAITQEIWAEKFPSPQVHEVVKSWGLSCYHPET